MHLIRLSDRHTATKQAELESERAGVDIHVDLKNGNSVTGIFNEIRDSVLYLTIEEHEWAISFTDIERIRVDDHKYRYIGMSAGAGVDILFFGLMMKQSWDSSGPILRF